MKNYKRIFIPLLILSITAPISILVTYGFHVGGNISSNPSDWNVFGSVLGGSFTLLGGLATSLTLLFLHEQQKINLELITKQNASLTFEQYIQHISNFKSFIQPVGSRNRITFSDPDKLYQRIFPTNRPTLCDFTASLDISSNTILIALIENLDLLDNFTKHPDTQTFESNIATVFAELKELVAINFDQYLSGHGKINANSKETGLYLSQLEFQFTAIKDVISEILFFSGHDRNSRLGSIEDWHEPVREMVKIICLNEDGPLKLDNASRGAKGAYNLYTLTQPLNQILELKKDIQDTFKGPEFNSMLQLGFAKKKGQRWARLLTEAPNYQDIKDTPEILAIKRQIVEYLDYDHRFFNI